VVRPAVLFEITSPDTRRADFGRKRRQYERARVPEYVIVDRGRRLGLRPPQLLGFRLTDGRYRRVEPDPAGRLWLETVRLWIAASEDGVVCHDEAGRLLEDHVATVEARQAAEARAAEAEARLRALEAELPRLRGEPPLP